MRGGTVDAVVATLRDAGFKGDREHYDDPANSFLDQVIARARGLPILLSALTIAVATRAGLHVDGVGLPGHFIVVDRSAGELRYLDPFGGWAELSLDRLAEIVRSFGGGMLHDEHLRPVPPAEMARRMLLNLRGSYLARRRPADALWTLELEEIIDPGDPGLRLRMRSLLIGLGRYDEAERSARAELAGSAPEDVRAETEAQLEAIQQMRYRMN